MSCDCHGSHENEGGRKDYQYAVKIVVGNITKQDKSAPLPIGKYFTKINVHNNSRCDCVTFKWKVAIGNPGLRIGPISAFSEAMLCADEALEIVNSDIIKKLGDKLPAHFEGWVVIETPQELDVVAVYGTAGIDTEQVNAFHTERVQPRCMTPCEDLYGDVSSGAAMWELKRPNQTQFAWATLSTKHPDWVSAPQGSVWVTPSGDGERNELQGQYIYRLKFKLCSGFSTPAMNFQMAADNKAVIKLNGTQINPSTGIPNFVTMTTFAVTTGFKVGENELIIEVSNEGGPTGLLVHGDFLVKDGQCPGESFPRWACPGIKYQVHVRRLFPWVTGAEGWIEPESRNGEIAGTTGQHRRLEAFRANLIDPPGSFIAPGTRIQYRGHVKDDGWTGWKDEGVVCGNPGNSQRMEAIEARFVVAPPCCSISYMVHMRKKLTDIFSSEQGGNSPWMSDGATAGTTGDNRRIEAIWMQIGCVLR